MHVRVGDALRRGRILRDQLGTDLLEVDYHDFAAEPLDVVRNELGLAPKSARAVAAGSPGVFEDAGMTPFQLQYATSIDS